MSFNLGLLDKLSVLVVGDAMLDRYVWGAVHRVSPEAPVPVVEVQRESTMGGGAANVALNLAALGIPCELFSVLGADAAGDELREVLSQRGITIDPRLVWHGCPTITKTRIIAQHQQVCRLDRESPPDNYFVGSAEWLVVLADRLKHHNVVIVSDYAKGVVTQPIVDCLRVTAARRGQFLAMDPKPKHVLDINGFHLLTPNRSEVFALAGLQALAGNGAGVNDACAQVIERYRPEYLVVTLSEHGMLLVTRAGVAQHFPTAVREVADISGAGDTVIAVLAACLAAGMAPSDAVRLANVAAGIVVGKQGTATVKRKELAEALDRSTWPAFRLPAPDNS